MFYSFFRRLAPWIGALVVAAQPLVTFAQFGSNKIPTNTGLSTNTDPIGMIGSLIGSALEVLGIVALVLIIYAGFLWMTAQGETEKVEKARDILIQATIGLIIISLAYSISYYVTDKLGTVLGAVATSNVK